MLTFLKGGDIMSSLIPTPEQLYKKRKQELEEAWEQMQKSNARKNQIEKDIETMTYLLMDLMSTLSDRDVVKYANIILEDDKEITNLVRKHTKRKKKQGVNTEYFDTLHVTKEALKNVRDAALYNVDRSYGEFPPAIDQVVIKRKPRK